MAANQGSTVADARQEPGGEATGPPAATGAEHDAIETTADPRPGSDGAAGSDAAPVLRRRQDVGDLVVRAGTAFADYRAGVPGAIDTVRDWSQYTHQEKERICSEIPCGRFGHTDEVAAACAFLCAETGGFVSGQAIHVNGGHYMF